MLCGAVVSRRNGVCVESDERRRDKTEKNTKNFTLCLLKNASVG